MDKIERGKYIKHYLSNLPTRFYYVFPDGSHTCIPVWHNENLETKIELFLKNWYELVKDSKDVSYIRTNLKCPICGEVLYRRIGDVHRSIFCPNYSCRYFIRGE